MKTLAAILVMFVLAGCATAPKFVVKNAGSGVPKNKNPSFISAGNRISRVTFAGTLYRDKNSGVYIDPFVKKSPTGKILQVGFHIANKINFQSKDYHGLELGTIQWVLFRLRNGQIIALHVKGTSYKSRKVSSYRYGFYDASPRFHGSSYQHPLFDKTETGTASASIADFRKLAHAKGIACQIVGSRQTVTYNEKEILPSFLANIRKFYDSHVE